MTNDEGANDELGIGPFVIHSTFALRHSSLFLRQQTTPMQFLQNNLLTLLIFLPAAGAIVVMLVRGRDAVRWTTLAVTALTFVLSLLLLFTFDWTKAGDYATSGTGVVQMVDRKSTRLNSSHS